jgi:hypothetical protein
LIARPVKVFDKYRVSTASSASATAQATRKRCGIRISPNETLEPM